MRTAITGSLIALAALLQPSRADCSSGFIPVKTTDSNYETSLASLPLTFEKNLGQVATHVDFIARAGQYSFLLSPSGLRIVDSGDMSRGVEIILARNGRPLRAIGAHRLPGVVNYFRGSNPRAWRTKVPTYAEVRYPGAAPKIDLIYRGNRDQLEYDFVVAPGADPSRISMRLAGAENVMLQGGVLVLQSAIGEFRMHKPIAFQEIRGQRVTVAARWAVAANTISFVVGEYDRTQPLVIDPVVSYVNLKPYEARALVDGSDAVYIGAPSASGVFEVRKTTWSGSMVYATLLGSAGNSELRLGAVDNAGNAYVIGADSLSVPMVNPIPDSSKGGACGGLGFDKGLSCGDAVVVKLDPTGNVVFSTLLGGSLGEFASAIAVDKTGRLYVAGETASTDFPTVNAAQPKASNTVGITPCGGSTATFCQADVFVAAIDPAASALLYSTYLGGTESDFPYGIAVDSQGSAYVTGFTRSPDLQLAQATHDDGRGFAAKYDATGALRFATYLGASFEGTAIGIDPSGNVLIAGDENPGWNGFLRKLAPDGQELSTWLIQSVVATNVSGNPTKVTWMSIDGQGTAYLTGYTQAYDLPLVNSVQAQQGGYLDAFVTALSSSGQVVFSTYLGGSEADQALTIALDSSDSIHVAGSTVSSDFPLLDQSDLAATGDGRGFVVKMDAGSSMPLQVSPNNVVFPPQLKATTATQTLAITNASSAPVTLSSIGLEPSPYSSSNFAVASGCGAQIPPGGECRVQVSWTPQYAGEEVATLLIRSGVGRLRIGVHGKSLEPGAAARMSPQTPPGYAVPGQTVQGGLIRIVNFGTEPLRITNITTTDDFGSTTDCTGSLVSAEPCTVYLSFSPTTPGFVSGSVTISSNDVWGPQTWSLEGYGEDFAIDSPQNAANVTRGSSTDFPIKLTSNVTKAGEAVVVALSCSGLPAEAACSFKNSQLLVGSGGASTTLTITTSAPTAATFTHFKATYASLGLLGMFFCMFTRTRGNGVACVFLLALSVGLMTTACSSGSQDSAPPLTGTPLGTHNVVVTGTAGSLQHSTNLNLTVK